MSDSTTNELGNRFDSAYRGTPPWEIGAPQPALLALLDDFPPTGPVLDVGCGTGQLALALAQRELSVLGMDLAEAAIRQARANAAAAALPPGGSVEFQLGDSLHPARLGRRFGSVVDSGFFHIFDSTARDAFARELAAVLNEGGRYYLLGFAFESPYPEAPRPVHEEELRRKFDVDHGWKLLALRPARFITRPAPGGVPAVAACFERISV